MHMHFHSFLYGHIPLPCNAWIQSVHPAPDTDVGGVMAQT
jgi:hypothetical protein